jgi:DNA-binding XRE family transcriptional regulator
MENKELRESRERAGWSQARAAQELGVAIQTVQAWEQGRHPIPAWVDRLLPLICGGEKL